LEPVPDGLSSPRMGAGGTQLPTILPTFRAHSRIYLSHRDLEMEAGGIEPRNPDLEASLQQVLARLGEDGLASCLAALCRHPLLAQIVLVVANTRRRW
jgi:hypothetical protein